MFPILLVIVLAFVAQRLIGPDERSGDVSYNRFLNQVEQAPETIETVTLDTSDAEVEVAQRDGTEYTTGYPPSAEESLVTTLQRRQVETVVEGRGGSSVLSLIAYVLPFLLFLGFWLFLSTRMQRDRTAAATFGEIAAPSGLTAVVGAGSAEEAERIVRASLPPGRDYRIGPARPR